MLQFLVETLLRASDLALVAFGLSVGFGLVKFPNLCLVQFATIGAIVAHLLARLGLPLWLACAGGVVLAGIIAVFLHFAIFDRLLRTSSALAMIGSYAVAMVLTAIFLLCVGTAATRFDIEVEAPVAIAGSLVTPMQLWTFGASTLAVAFLWFVFNTTDLGRCVRATATNEKLAMVTGIDTRVVTTIVIFLSGCLAATGGIILALRGEIHIRMGDELLLPVFAAAMVGGLGNPFGAVFATLIIASAETAIVSINFGPLLGQDYLFLPASYLTAGSYLVLIVTLIFRPNGILAPEAKRA